MIHWTAKRNGRTEAGSSSGISKRLLRKDMEAAGYTDIKWTDRYGMPTAHRQRPEPGLGQLLGSFFRVGR
jgi:hypothetical protein